jgi:hypothetical protein
MVACMFCGSEDTRPSGSSTLDDRLTRVRRALTLRCLYRCRNCDGLFEAAISAAHLLPILRSQGRRGKEKGSHDPARKIHRVSDNKSNPVLFPHHQSAEIEP